MATDAAVPCGDSRIRRSGNGITQNLIHLTQFTDLTIRCPDPPLLVGIPIASLAPIELGLKNPAPQRLQGTVDLRCHPIDCRPLHGVLAFVLEDHPHRVLTDFGGSFG